MPASIHPFPARMAPELALRELSSMPERGVVLDPMTGSGTVLKHAADLGHRAFGYDLDPLAVMMSRVLTTTFDSAILATAIDATLEKAGQLRGSELAWIDADKETKDFVTYWFGAPQQRDLRGIAAAFGSLEASGFESGLVDVLRIALSRIIVTKEKGASLARDVSHSRPHKVATTSTYDVMTGFRRSAARLVRQLNAAMHNPSGSASVALGDARYMPNILDSSVDLVLTSPPYLNAIDYMRGHRMSLVWLGYSVSVLRTIRGDSIGAERGSREPTTIELEVREAMTDGQPLSPRHAGIVNRYIRDVAAMVSEVVRVTRPGGRVVFVVGDSALAGTFVRNSTGVSQLAERAGLSVVSTTQRDLPMRHRYLPIPLAMDAPLGMRMRTENVIALTRPVEARRNEAPNVPR